MKPMVNCHVTKICHSFLLFASQLFLAQTFYLFHLYSNYILPSIRSSPKPRLYFGFYRYGLIWSFRPFSLRYVSRPSHPPWFGTPSTVFVNSADYILLNDITTPDCNFMRKFTYRNSEPAPRCCHQWIYCYEGVVSFPLFPSKTGLFFSSRCLLRPLKHSVKLAPACYVFQYDGITKYVLCFYIKVNACSYVWYMLCLHCNLPPL